jgi:hypothetical protein
MNKIKKYVDLKGRKWEGDGIPKWVFKTGPFEVETLPPVMSSIYNSMIDDNSGYELFFFSDKDCEEFIKEEFGDYYLKLYNRLIPGAYKADLWRYLILFTYGGIYGDFTQVMVMKFDEITEGVDKVFCIDTPWAPFALHNAFMASKSNDIVVEAAIKMTIRNLENKDYGTDPLDVTGPVVLGKAYNSILHPDGNNLQPIKLGTNGKDKIITYPNDGDIFLKDVDGNNILVRKLNNHYEYMYNDKPHYGHYWKSNNIFYY